MATKILGPTGSRRRRRFLFIPILLVACTALFLIGSAQAVHDEGVFQLDGNASTAVDSTPPALEDWDLICKASRVSVGTLAAAITSTSATSISVNETVEPRIIPFRIQIDNEQMTVTGRTGALNPRTYTVTRGANGTTAATHASGATLFSGCLFNPAFAVPAGTTKASPHTFIVDPSESATDDILKGGTKDDNDINIGASGDWAWTSAKPAPSKNDLTDGYAAEYTCKGTEPNSVSTCSGTTGDKLLYFGADRLSINGSANIAFWFFHKDTQQLPNAANGQCSIPSGCDFGDSDGNPVSHTVGNVSLGGSQGLGCNPNPDPVTNICTPGDILVISAFGAHALINVYEWVGPGNATRDYLGTNSCFTSVCTLQPLATGGQECGNGIGQSGPNDNACAITNSTQVPSPWPVPQKEAPNNTFGADAGKGTAAFFEGGLNLTELGLASSCFSSFLINTRSSAAGDAELHDKIMGEFQRCAPNLTTQVQKGGVNFNGEALPGQAINDTATIQVTGATNPDDATGTVDFFLCSDTVAPFVAPDCTTGGVAAGTDKPLVDTSSPANTHDGLSGATSDNVNTAASPLSPGAYCFRAEADLNNYDDPDHFTNLTTECFTVAKLPTTTVTTPVDGSGVETHQILLGGSIFDKAVVTGEAAGGDPTGTVSFFLCKIDSGTCDGTTNVGTPVTGNPVTCVPDGTTPPNDTTFTCSATSGEVTPSAIGRYCFRAEYSGNTVYNGSKDSAETECFTVIKLNTTLVTDPQTCSGSPAVCVTNHGPFALADNVQVFDHAVVTGDAADSFPEGTVTFFICNPSQVSGAPGAEVCGSSAGTQVGSPVTVTHVAGETIKSEATSAAVTANQLGVWCFRAVYTSTSPHYNGSAGDGHEECFTVTTTSSGTSAQNWLPNDHIVVSTASGTLAGTLSIRLFKDSCDPAVGTLVYTEPVPNGGAFTATAAGASYDTTNGAVAGTTFKVTDANEGTYFWRIVFTPNSSFATGFTKCENTVLTIND